MAIRHDRPLQLSDRLRTFEHRGRWYAHTSAVPLAYLTGSPAFVELLHSFDTPRRPHEGAGTSEARLVSVLVRAGVLRDAEAPDPVHDLVAEGTRVATLYLYPTSSCNLRCVYCYATSGPGAGPRLSAEHALAAVDGFFADLADDVRTVRLRFHGGGEPTTNFAVMQAAAVRFGELAAARGLRSAVTTITNGTFGPAVLRVLLESRWGITVSYDGPRQPDQRPTAAGRDSRDRVAANLRAMAAEGLPVGTRATLTRDGLASMRALVDDAAALGIRRVQVEPASIVGRGANLDDGPPDPQEFADAFLEAFRHGLRSGVALGTAAWSHTRVGDGRYCGAIRGARGLTPDGYLSACTEVCDGSAPDDPFLVGRLDPGLPRLEIWPVREGALQSRVGYDLPHCRSCFMVDTCAGGCASRARSVTGDLFDRDEAHCTISRRVNREIIADLADGRLLPDEGWQPFGAAMEEPSAPAGVTGRVVALVPPFARRRWNADPQRRPLFVPAGGAAPFFHLPPGA